MKAESFDNLHSAAMSADNIPSSKIMTAIAASAKSLEHFYLTGFEGLCLGLSHATLTEAVISSVVPFDRELLVIGGSEVCALWRSVCRRLSIQLTAVDVCSADLMEAVSTILANNANISHIMCAADCGLENLAAIGTLARQFRCAFVVDNSSDLLTLSDLAAANIDFLIAASADDVAVIVARRSKLVQTEGNARRDTHDIYALWQGSMAERRPTLVPMA